MKELYDRTFKVNDQLKHKLLRYEQNKETPGYINPKHMIVEIPLEHNKDTKEFDREIFTIIWRIRQIFIPKIKLVDSNLKIKSKDAVAYIMMHDESKDRVYIDITGRIWMDPVRFQLHHKLKKSDVVNIPLSMFGRWVDVPSLDGVKQALNIINMLRDENVMDVVDQHVLDKFANMSGENAINMSQTVLHLRENARRNLNKRGYHKFRVKE